ncbi:MAG: N-acetylneuraminate synthase [Proteobacteria bacterium]|nr:N-acetylneuraminate synthase [Pseudomonadota bacterium]
MDRETFIIAEAGVNHNGSPDVAKRLIEEAAAAGADAVKFQTFKAENIVARQAPKATYQMAATDPEESQLQMLKKLELGEEIWQELINHCQENNILFLSTPFDLDSIETLTNLAIPIFKIPSGEITNLPYLRKVGGLGKELILSTGMADMAEIEAALAALDQAGTPHSKITVLHCNTQYPTAMEDVNLKAMATIAKTLKVKVGYSDHTLGIEVPIAAVALGATIIEKHFTLDRAMPGPDHRASLEPCELKAMVIAIRNIEKALGSGVKAPSPSELPNRVIARKSIVAATLIHQGELLTETNLTSKRPGSGLSPMVWDRVVGSKAIRDFQPDELIEI